MLKLLIEWLSRDLTTVYSSNETDTNKAGPQLSSPKKRFLTIIACDDPGVAGATGSGIQGTGDASSVAATRGSRVAMP